MTRYPGPGDHGQRCVQGESVSLTSACMQRAPSLSLQHAVMPRRAPQAYEGGEPPPPGWV